MSYGSIRTPPTRSRHFSRTGTSTPPTLAHEGSEYFSSRRQSGAFDGLNKRAKRGKSPHDILNHGDGVVDGDGVISSEERSGQFVGIPIDEKEIGKLPKKVSHPSLPSALKEAGHPRLLTQTELNLELT